MTTKVLIAHAPGEEEKAEVLAKPIREAGYEVVHCGTVLVGASVTEEASIALASGGPVVLCGTVRALGTGWAHKLVNAAKSVHPQQPRVFPVQFEQEAYLVPLGLDAVAADYWQDQGKAVHDLITALRRYYPLDDKGQEGNVDWGSYRQTLWTAYQWVRLAVISGAKRDRVTHIPLRDVFTAQVCNPGLPSYDISDEVLEFKRKLYASNSNDSEGSSNPEGRFDDTLLDEEPNGLPEEVSNLFARERTQVILGGPGSGKSTLLHFAILALCNPSPEGQPVFANLAQSPVPFLIELRDFALQPHSDFVGYIVANTEEQHGVTIQAEGIRKLLEAERQALVMFDGLDEIFDPVGRSNVIRRFKAFSRQFPQALIIVTSRIVGYDAEELGLAGFEHYSIRDFGLQQIREFISKWYRYYTWEGDQRDASSLLERVAQSPRLMDLAGNPLLLTMMAIIYKHHDLPEQRWQLYQHCTEVLLEEWDIKRKHLTYKDILPLDITIGAHQKAEILQRVAVYMLERGQTDKELNAIAYQPLLHILATYLVEKYGKTTGEAEAFAGGILSHLRERTYILAEIGQGIFGFVHRTFMEYFAACKFKAEFNTKKSDYGWLIESLFRQNWRKSEWQEVLLLLIAMLAEQKSPIGEIIDRLRHVRFSGLPDHLLFAGRCLAEAGEVEDVVSAQQLAHEIVMAVSQYAELNRREQFQRKRDKYQAFLSSAVTAFSALAEIIETTQPTREIIWSLWRSNALQQRIIGWQLGLALEGRPQRRVFALAALSDQEEAIRRGAIAVLEREWPGDEWVGNAIALIVESDHRLRVRQAALQALHRSWPGQQVVLTRIEARLSREQSIAYLSWLLHYLSRYWKHDLQALRLSQEVFHRLQQVDEGVNCVLMFIDSLNAGWPRSEKAAAMLAQLAAPSSPQNIRQRAIEALGDQEASRDEIDAILQSIVLEDSDAKLRLTALNTLAGMRPRSETFLSLLMDRMAKDPAPLVRLSASEHFERALPVATELRLPKLIERITTDPEPTVRQLVAQFPAFDDGFSTHLRGPLLADSDPTLRILGIMLASRVMPPTISGRNGENYHYLNEPSWRVTHRREVARIHESIATVWFSVFDEDYEINFYEHTTHELDASRLYLVNLKKGHYAYHLVVPAKASRKYYPALPAVEIEAITDLLIKTADNDADLAVRLVAMECLVMFKSWEKSTEDKLESVISRIQEPALQARAQLLLNAYKNRTDQ